MSYRSISVDVDIDVKEILSEATVEELQDELKSRSETSLGVGDSNALYEALYYALRDGNFEKAAEAAKPLIEDKIGRIL